MPLAHQSLLLAFAGQYTQLLVDWSGRYQQCSSAARDLASFIGARHLQTKFLETNIQPLDNSSKSISYPLRCLGVHMPLAKPSLQLRMCLDHRVSAAYMNAVFSLICD